MLSPVCAASMRNVRWVSGVTRIIRYSFVVVMVNLLYVLYANVYR